MDWRKLPEPFTEAFKVVATYELSGDGRTFRIDVLHRLGTDKPDFSVRYSRKAGSEWIEVESMPWIHQPTAEGATDQAVHWLAGKVLE